jgi:hypothetical protein
MHSEFALKRALSDKRYALARGMTRWVPLEYRIARSSRATTPEKESAV